MSYPKPLAGKSLQRLYQTAGIDEVQSEFLHQFFGAAANLYGAVSLRDLWEAYKTYSVSVDAPALKRKDFIAFSEIARREAEVPYYVFEIDELYDDVKRADLSREIVYKPIIGIGYGRLSQYYHLLEVQDNFNDSYYLPYNFLEYANEIVTPQETKLLWYLSNLKVTAETYTNRFGKELSCGPKDKCLSEFSFIGYEEQFELDYASGKVKGGPKYNEKKVACLMEEFSGTMAQKLVRKFKWDVSMGWLFIGVRTENIYDSLGEVGVELTEQQRAKLEELLDDLEENIHLKCRRGWSVNDLQINSL